MRSLFTYKIGAIISLLFVFASCEKIIELDLNHTEDKLVVEAIVSNLNKQSVVRLSKSNPLFSAEPYQNLNNANVRMKTPEGDAYPFHKIEDGVYRNEDFIGKEGVEYQLEIDWEGITVNSVSNMPQVVLIDSIEVVVSERGFMRNDEIAYALKVHFSDPIDDANYYRIDVFNNDSLYEGFIVSDDLFFNGIPTFQFIMGYEMQPLDTICVQLSSIDEANYSYMLVLSQSDSPFIIAPGNPISNLTGNAIGYFGAYAQDRKYIVIPSFDYIN
ncbi:MAG: DUF4249 domain-containing protein [Bacteroidales bacterium]|jgi:hypothetical protein|nr:DUF4249 domain-containing protein [Bacteroidales bacterium]